MTQVNVQCAFKQSYTNPRFGWESVKIKGHIIKGILFICMCILLLLVQAHFPAGLHYENLHYGTQNILNPQTKSIKICFRKKKKNSTRNSMCDWLNGIFQKYFQKKVKSLLKNPLLNYQVGDQVYNPSSFMNEACSRM